MSWIAGVVRPASRAGLPGTVAEARAAGRVLVPSGTGTGLGRGLAPREPVWRLDLGGLDRVVEHETDDFTITVEAGIPLAALNRTLAGAGQWLPPAFAFATGTLGGLVGSDRRSLPCGRHGGIREFLLGMTFLDAERREVRVGAKVVKSVAGYDLMKAFTGSLGQFGPILELTVRVLPRPARWGVQWRPGRPGAEERRRLLAEIPRRVFPDAFVRVADAEGERWAIAVSGSEARVAGLLEEADRVAGSAARTETTVEPLLEASARAGAPGAAHAFGGAAPEAAWAAAAPAGSLAADLLDGHVWWRPAPGESPAPLREDLGDGVLHWEDPAGTASAWGWDGGAEGAWWARLKQALDPGGAWVAGRWPGGR